MDLPNWVVQLKPPIFVCETTADARFIHGGAEVEAVTATLQEGSYVVHKAVMACAHFDDITSRLRLILYAKHNSLSNAEQAPLWPQATGALRTPCLHDIMEEDADVPPPCGLTAIMHRP